MKVGRGMGGRVRGRWVGGRVRRRGVGRVGV